MSQLTQSRPAASPSREPNHLRRPVVREDLELLPTIIGREAAVRFCNEVLGVPITPTRMRRGIERRELPVAKIQARNGFAPRDLYDWILGMQRPAAEQGGRA
ncbi:hypothetical protein [Tsukamurella paurometabola]|uniref:Uncharacterized protein n=1 Tax=Tsukamurella paurometabola TaxID=2061 RepID=A0ABS5NHG2_TSUPA|nr:hypothetical protein [Tsukamurella paurometabola]MBS4103708.1 hypothetical protein [Tsukamurella paurometabola]